MKKEKKFLGFIFLAVFVSALFFISANALAADAKTESKIVSPFDVLQVKIPGLDALLKTDEAQVKCTGEGKDKICEYPWVGIYIKAVYKFLVGISGMLAVIVMMAGGYYWLFAGGNAGRVTQAKEYIGGAVVGLTLALGSYMILNLINPEILTLKALRIGNIPLIEVIVDGDTSTPMDPRFEANSSDVGLATSGDLQIVVSRAFGRVTYGMNTKNEHNDIGRGCLGKGNILDEGGKKTVCYDCSGFARYVIKAVYSKTIPEGTAEIFKGKSDFFYGGDVTFVREEDIKFIESGIKKAKDARQAAWLAEAAKKARDRRNKEIAELKKIPAGTLVGWTSDDNSGNGGHVLISMGNGEFVDAHGGPGREVGKAIGMNTAESFYKHRNYLKVYKP